MNLNMEQYLVEKEMILTFMFWALSWLFLGFGLDLFRFGLVGQIRQSGRSFKVAYLPTYLIVWFW